jgi:hypothetical protein
MFRNIILFHSEELLAPRPTSKLEDHPLSAVHDCLLNVFAATLHNWKPFLHLQPEDVPCCGDRDPLNTGSFMVPKVTPELRMCPEAFHFFTCFWASYMRSNTETSTGRKSSVKNLSTVIFLLFQIPYYRNGRLSVTFFQVGSNKRIISSLNVRNSPIYAASLHSNRHETAVACQKRLYQHISLNMSTNKYILQTTELHHTNLYGP